MAKSNPSTSRDKAKRAQLSCYTCRQRKVKCDRVKPCSSCVQYQDPDGCRYDISDDKRQPMLMADAYKQLRRENSELKAKEEDNQAAITKCKAENAALKARLAAFQIRNSQPSICSASNSPPIWSQDYPMPYPPDNVHPNVSKEMCQVAKISSSHSRPNNLIEDTVRSSILQDSMLTQDDLQLRSGDFHEKEALSQALNMANFIVSNVQKARQPDDSFLQRSAQNLVMVLSDLPNEFPFTLPIQARTKEIYTQKVSTQAILVSQTLHSHIITLLSCLGSRSTTRTRQSHKQFIHLAEPLRRQLITSCFVILALLQYLNAQPENSFFDPGICRQSYAALTTISQLDPSIEGDLFQTSLKQMATRICKQEVTRPPIPVSDMCIEPVLEIVHLGSDQHIQLHRSSLSSDLAGYRDDIGGSEPVTRAGQAPLKQGVIELCSTPWPTKDETTPVDQTSSRKGSLQSVNGMYHASTIPCHDLAYIYKQHKLPEYSLQRSGSSPATIDCNFYDSNTSQTNQAATFPVHGPVEVSGSIYQPSVAQHSHNNNIYSAWKAPTTSDRITSGQEISNIVASMPSQLANPIAYSTEPVSFIVDGRCIPSANICDSSLQTPIQSYPVSAVSTRRHMDGLGSTPGLFGLVQQASEIGSSLTNGDHK